MRMTINEIKAQVLRLSAQRVDHCYTALCVSPVASFTKLQRAEWLAQQVWQGAITLDQLSQPPRYSVDPDLTVMPSVPATAFDRVLADEVTQLQGCLAST